MTDPPQPEAKATLAVGAVVIDERGRILLIRRGRPPSRGAWTLPGGRVEAGESLEAAVVREVREETALDARVLCALCVVHVAREGYAYAIHEFLLAPSSDSPLIAGDDAADARWAARHELAGLDVRADVQDVVDQALAEAHARRHSL